MRAAEIADDVLFPAAAAVDAGALSPASHLDLLAASGFYGLSDFGDLAVAAEAFAGGCLATAFVWIQHHGVLRAASGSSWAASLAAGSRRAGIALVGLRTPSPLRVRRDGSSFVLDGTVPFVTGWGLIDTLLVAALSADGVVHFLLTEAVASSATPLSLVAAQASGTVTLTYDSWRVPPSRLLSTSAYASWAASDATGSALNGFLALGVASRCARLLGPSRLDAEVDAARAALLAAGLAAEAAPPGADVAAGVAEARAEAAAVAWRAAGALVARTGSRAVLAGQPAERLAREATLLLAFGTRPAIRDALTARLGA